MNTENIDQLREEIARLTAENRAAPDAERECKLASLRLRAFPRHNVTAVDTPWPPVYHNPFPAGIGIPEITADQLNLDTLASGILHHGAIIVRGLLKHAQADALRQDIDAVLSAQAARAAGKPITETRPWFAPPPELAEFKLGVGRKFIAETGGIWAMDSPRALFRVLEVYEQLGLKPLLQRYFGAEPCLSVRKWVLRRVAPLPQESDWHQDGSFMGTQIRSANLWVALNRCGGNTDTPGIELIPKRLNEIVKTGTHGARFEWVVGPEAIPEWFADTPPVCPLFDAGDAVFFDHFNLHRTSYGAHITRQRYAIECWFFSGGAYPVDQIPIAW